jgi:hypothetical protein
MIRTDDDAIEAGRDLCLVDHSAYRMCEGLSTSLMPVCMCMCATIRLGGEGKAEVVVTKRRLNAMHRSDGDTG